MSINTFAVLCHGYGKPGTVSGTDWAEVIQRGLFITRGYFPRRVWQIVEYTRGFTRMGTSMRLE